MDGNFEHTYHNLEDTHWWFVSRRRLWMPFLKQFSRQSRILEIGCSGGVLQQQLQALGFNDLTGIDISDVAIDRARQKMGDRVSVMDAQKLSFEDQSFDIIIASDVLEHLELEHQALTEWYRVLKPGGTLFVGVPAFMMLWSHHDVVNHHKRRYVPSSLKNALVKAGFSVQSTFFWNCFLFPLMFAVRMFQHVYFRESSNLGGPHPVVNTALKTILNIENFLLYHLKWSFLPFGGSVVSIVKKPN